MKKLDPNNLAKSSTGRSVEKLYVNDGLTMEQIAERFGTNRQRVFHILKERGVKSRPAANVRGSKRASRKSTGPLALLSSKEVAELVRKYVVDRASVYELKRQTGIGRKALTKLLVREGVEMRSAAHWRGVPHPEMAKLEIMESIVLDLPRKKKPHNHCYQTADKYGIKVSVRTVMKGVYRVTRIR